MSKLKEHFFGGLTMGRKRPKRISYKVIFEPIEAKCAVCGNPCFIVPIGEKGCCLCATCTFGSQKPMTLIEMLTLIHSPKKEKKVCIGINDASVSQRKLKYKKIKHL